MDYFICYMLGLVTPAVVLLVGLLLESVYESFCDCGIWKHLLPKNQITEEDLRLSENVCPDAKFYRKGRLIWAWNSKRKYWEFAIMKKER